MGPTTENNQDKLVCYQTLYYVLVTLTKLLAPINPFITDEIYTNLTGEESVHLSDWPEVDKEFINPEIEKNMHLTRQIVERGHAARKEAGLNVRQPLQLIKVRHNSNPLTSDYEKLIQDELNIKQIEWDKASSNEIEVDLDTKLTSKLKSEGQAREIIREIQIARKNADCELTQYVTVTLPDWPKEFTEEIKRQTLAKELVKGEQLQIN